MNNSKKIEFSKSTLLSLKAELLRKQDEVSKAKLDPRNQVDNFKPLSSKHSDKPEKKRASLKSKDSEDPEFKEALRKSKMILEKKAELYDSLAQGTQSQNSEQYLVQFHKKVTDGPSTSSENTNKEVIDKPLVLSDDEDVCNQVQDETEWVEYVDYLGRSRKCHISDLEAMKEREKYLQNLQGEQQPKKFVKEGEKLSDEGELQSPDAYREMLRLKWEQEEQELLKKDTIHYQDVLFDEARAHGVSYYAFSTEQAKRARQHAELRESRTETQRAQHEAQERRTARDMLMRERVRAARARQRARAGLPPEEEPQRSVTDLLLDFVDEQRRISDVRDKEEEMKKREEIEKERQKEREKHVREWDVGKEGTEGKVFKEMTQEQWVDMQREKRDEEFAPFHTSQNVSEKSRAFNRKGTDLTKSTENLTWDDVRPKPLRIEDPVLSEIPEEDRTLFFTSRSKLQSMFNESSCNNPTENSSVKVPIKNELSDECKDSDSSEDGHMKQTKPVKGVEIAPPPTYDYYGPSSSKRRKYDTQTKKQAEESIEKGLKHLRKQSEKKYLRNRDFSEFNL